LAAEVVYRQPRVIRLEPYATDVAVSLTQEVPVVTVVDRAEKRRVSAR